MFSKNGILVFSREMVIYALETNRFKTDTGIISISEKKESLPVIKKEGYIVDYIQFVFADIKEPVDGLTLFNSDMAREILNFVENNKDRINTLLVHCDAGISRSAGVAAAISKIYFGDDTVFFKRYLPNSLVYSTILNEYYK